MRYKVYVLIEGGVGTDLVANAVAAALADTARARIGDLPIKVLGAGSFADDASEPRPTAPATEGYRNHRSPGGMFRHIGPSGSCTAPACVELRAEATEVSLGDGDSLHRIGGDDGEYHVPGSEKDCPLCQKGRRVNDAEAEGYRQEPRFRTMRLAGMDVPYTEVIEPPIHPDGILTDEGYRARVASGWVASVPGVCDCDFCERFRQEELTAAQLRALESEDELHVRKAAAGIIQAEVNAKLDAMNVDALERPFGEAFAGATVDVDGVPHRVPEVVAEGP